MLGYIAARSFLLIGLVTTVALGAYILYWRYIHPLAKYPGPFLASLSDLWQYRLWISYIGLTLATCGTVAFLVQIENASSHWNIIPLVGVAIAAAVNQIVTTVYVTHAVDCNTSEAASVGVLITFFRQIWGFIGPFWFKDMLENVGFSGSAGICSALIVGAAVVPTVLLHLWGQKWHNP